MTLPHELRLEVEPVLGPIRDAAPVPGGCVSDALRVTTDGGPVFLKHDPRAPAGMFEVEADALRALAEPDTMLRVPAVLGHGERWLALEWLEPGRASAGADDRLGHGLARLHSTRSDRWGWHRQGYIGPLPQQNHPSDDWPEFWRASRLEPQLRRARDAGAAVGPEDDWARLFAELPNALPAAEGDGASLLHGDLWSGNTFVTAAGDAALVDPATYFGHREVDLAMADLFGGFGPRFRAAYTEAWPLSPGYPEVRRGIYQLYYLLVHVNLFGGGYAARTRGVLNDVLRGLSR